jgi:hypothetical protein
MVVRNKLYGVFDKYRNLLKSKLEKRGRGFRNGYGGLSKGNKTKNKILDFYLKNHHWPSRLSGNKAEKQLATKFENFVSKTAASYDPHFRRIAMLTGRTTNNKRKHNIKGFKKEILEFIETHGYVPQVKRHETIEGEGELRNKLNRYTLTKNDMSFLGKVYSLDPCHRSGIPSKFRAIINEILDTETPLIRMV